VVEATVSRRRSAVDGGDVVVGDLLGCVVARHDELIPDGEWASVCGG
jgi:hypothetical protein